MRIYWLKTGFTLQHEMQCKKQKVGISIKEKIKIFAKKHTPNKNIEEKTVHHFDGLCLFYLRTRMCPLHSLSPRMLSPGYFHP